MAALLWKILEFYGQDADRLFRSEGLDPARMHDPNARFPDARVDALWEKAGALISDPCFGLRAARCWHPNMLGALGYAWLASSTLRTAFGRLERYSRLLADVSDLQLKEAPEGMSVRLAAARQQEREIPGLVDASLSAILDMCRVNYGETPGPGIGEPAPGSATLCRAVFRVLPLSRPLLGTGERADPAAGGD